MGFKLYDRAYFNYLVEPSTDIELFKENFPKMEYGIFLEFVDGILNNIEREIANYKLGLSEKEIKELKDFPEFRLLQEKKRYALSRKREYANKMQEQANSFTIPYRNIIFATMPSGNVCLEQDLKNIDEENYGKFKEALIRLRNNDRDFNTEKQKPMSGKSICNGLYEIKDFQFRLVYMIIDKETVLAIMAEDKIKETSSKKKTRQPAQRKMLVINQVKKYQELLQDEEKKQQIIALNDTIYEKLMAKLSKGRNVK